MVGSVPPDCESVGNNCNPCTIRPPPAERNPCAMLKLNL